MLVRGRKPSPTREAYAPAIFAALAVVGAAWSFALAARLRDDHPYVWVLIGSGAVLGLALLPLEARRNRVRMRRGKDVRIIPTSTIALLGFAGSVLVRLSPPLVQAPILAIAAGACAVLTILAFR